MAPRPRKSAHLDPEAHERLLELQTSLRSRRLPGRIEGQDILSALVLYTPLPQLIGMLQEYWPYTEERDAQGGGD
jgi:hypothetical protein